MYHELTLDSGTRKDVENEEDFKLKILALYTGLPTVDDTSIRTNVYANNSVCFSSSLNLCYY